MAFESLSERYEFRIQDFPSEWLPLTYLYDPDLPLFPLQYFHFIDPDLGAGARPGERDRIFGFIHHINLLDRELSVTVALNKDLTSTANERLRLHVEGVVRDRLGLGDPVTLADIKPSLKEELSGANHLVEELWYQVVDRSFGKSLPFGKVWDPIFGLIRFIASWNSEGGRKGELIQTHFFASEFGVRVPTGGGIHVDFYLLPTLDEFLDSTNPLNLFPAFAELIRASDGFVSSYCDAITYGGLQFSAFRIAKTGVGSKLKTETIVSLINKTHGRERDALFNNYSAFNRGPHRSIIALMMLHDFRYKWWHPNDFTPELCALMYQKLGGSYQSPKVIQLYAQQCFGTSCVLPIDNWVETFVRWPLGFRETAAYYGRLFSCSNVWGKIERLIWVASQARKVHSSVCADILWCIRFGGPEKQMRGANPLSCKICAEHIRRVCPAFAAIKTFSVVFNGAPYPAGAFRVVTSDGNNSSTNQTIVCSSGFETYDEYSTRDRPEQYSRHPLPGHDGSSMTVAEFIDRY